MAARAGFPKGDLVWVRAGWFRCECDSPFFAGLGFSSSRGQRPNLTCCEWPERGRQQSSVAGLSPYLPQPFSTHLLLPSSALFSHHQLFSPIISSFLPSSALFSLHPLSSPFICSLLPSSSHHSLIKSLSISALHPLSPLRVNHLRGLPPSEVPVGHIECAGETIM